MLSVLSRFSTPNTFRFGSILCRHNHPLYYLPNVLLLYMHVDKDVVTTPISLSPLCYKEHPQGYIRGRLSDERVYVAPLTLFCWTSTFLFVENFKLDNERWTLCFYNILEACLYTLIIIVVILLSLSWICRFGMVIPDRFFCMRYSLKHV